MVNPDGRVEREMRMDGRGGDLFQAPGGNGWEVEKWTTGGTAALLPDTEYHARARGVFQAGQEIPSDYRLNMEKQAAGWNEEEKKRIEAAGVKPPYAEHLYSRNRVRVQRVKGLLTVTTFYEETFENAGIITLLLEDLKREVRRQNANAPLKDEDASQLARLRLEEEILPAIRFKSELELPGKLLEANGRREGRQKVFWEFTLKDFEKNYSLYTLRASSRMLTPAARILFALLVFLLAALILLTLAGGRKRREPKGRKPA